jgi:hypothetical protein
MNGSETNADGANAYDLTAWRPPFDALSAILQRGMLNLNVAAARFFLANAAVGAGIADGGIDLLVKLVNHVRRLQVARAEVRYRVAFAVLRLITNSNLLG